MDEFHALMSQLGMRNYTCAYPLQGEGPCIVTMPMLPSPPVLMAMAVYFQSHEIEAVVLQKASIR